MYVHTSRGLVTYTCSLYRTVMRFSWTKCLCHLGLKKDMCLTFNIRFTTSVFQFLKGEMMLHSSWTMPLKQKCLSSFVIAACVVKGQPKACVGVRACKSLLKEKLKQGPTLVYLVQCLKCYLGKYRNLASYTSLSICQLCSFMQSLSPTYNVICFEKTSPLEVKSINA